jgi:hypothetical protein
MKTMDGVVRRLPVKGPDGSIDLIEIDAIFYLEAQGEDTLIRTKRKKPYKSVQRHFSSLIFYIQHNIPNRRPNTNPIDS